MQYLHIAKMAWMIAWSQPKSTVEPQTSLSVPLQEKWADDSKGKVVADYKLNVDYKPKGSYPENEPDAKEEEENFGPEYAKMELPWQGTICQRSMKCRVAERIEWVHWVQGSEIMALWLQDMYIQLRFSPKAAKLLNREQELDSSKSLRVLMDKNVNDICNIMRKPDQKCQQNTQQGTTSFSHSPRKPKASCLLIPS